MTQWTKSRIGLLLLCGAVLPLEAQFPQDDGYRGIWYMMQPSNDQYGYKYSGGLATYPQQQEPIAVYAKAVNKTFFCYGGVGKDGSGELLHMVSYYDHATGRVPRPTILVNKRTEDAHDNPTIAIDARGYIWIFSSAHGTQRPSFVHRSREPYRIDDFEKILETNFSYTQPWFLAGRGFLFLHTRYVRTPPEPYNGRALYWMTSPNGVDWSEPSRLAFGPEGHYQISWPGRGRVGTAFNIMPGLKSSGFERTNLYYVETRDFGESWVTADGRRLETPIVTEQNAALLRNYRKEGMHVYLKDLQFDEHDRPVIVYLTSRGWASGPKNDPRSIQLARWTGNKWEFFPMMRTDHNYDFGSLYLERENRWRFIAPTRATRQPYVTGGEIEMWISRDKGRSWKREKELTRNSRHNHSYVRRPLHAHPDFYALWADGDALAPSVSHLYFANQEGDVYRLPPVMHEDTAKPELVSTR